MNKPKENAMIDFLEMVKYSWPYSRMTGDEKSTLKAIFSSNIIVADIQGTYLQRWNAYNAVYFAYLVGIGYNGALWREPHPEEIPFIPGGDML